MALQSSVPRVIIIGAGFGGLEAAKQLCDEPVRVTVIDRTNYHLFQPLLYQVATAALSPADIAAPIRSVLSKARNIEVVLAEVRSVDVNARTVCTIESKMSYDYLIVATGAAHVPEKLAPFVMVWLVPALFVIEPVEASARLLAVLVPVITVAESCAIFTAPAEL